MISMSFPKNEECLQESRWVTLGMLPGIPFWTQGYCFGGEDPVSPPLEAECSQHPKTHQWTISNSHSQVLTPVLCIFPELWCWPGWGISLRQNWFIRLVSGCWCLQQIQALALLCCCLKSILLPPKGKERRLSLPVPQEHSFTSAHFHYSIICHIQREIFCQIIQRMRSWSKFVKYFVILAGKTLQRSWCTTQVVFRVVLHKLTWLLIFFPGLFLYLLNIFIKLYLKSLM